MVKKYILRGESEMMMMTYMPNKVTMNAHPSNHVQYVPHGTELLYK